MSLKIKQYHWDGHEQMSVLSHFTERGVLVQVVLNLEADKNASSKKKEEMCLGSWQD